jgi:uncharacterized GH25 family protein
MDFINHHAWIEHSGLFAKPGKVRAYLKWGHFPEVDGKLDPQSITTAFARSIELKRPLLVGSDAEASSKGGLFLEFEAERLGVYTVGLQYNRGVYSVTKDQTWTFGDRKRIESYGYDVKEAVLLVGSAKTYILIGEESYVKPKPAGLELEIVPSTVKKFIPGDIVDVQVLYKGNPCSDVELTSYSAPKRERVVADSHGFADIKLKEGVNVIFARFRDESLRVEGVYDRMSINTTLSLITKGGA